MESIGMRLNEAAIEGNVTALLELLQQDPLLLNRVNLNETPLHVAALLGHVSFVDEILKRRPQLAKELDSQRCSPLHLAAAKGFVEIVKLLLQFDVSADMCFVCNQDGFNPLHLAAATGQVDALTHLIGAQPAAARTAVEDGGTVLHLCVKYNQLEALRILIETVAVDDSRFVNVKDDYGFTVLHLAVSNKQIQTVQYLVNSTEIEVNALNSNGLTALDILARSHRDLKDMDIAETLRAKGAFRTTTDNRTLSHMNTNRNQKTQTRFQVLPTIFNSHQIQSNPANQRRPNGHYSYESETQTWISRKKDTLMVVASLIATMAFQAGVNPPGGVWQDDTSSGVAAQRAGMSIMAGRDGTNYSLFLTLNTAGFMASLSVILMLITGLPFRHPVFLWILIITMWIAVSSIGLTYGISIRFITSTDDLQPGPIISKIAILLMAVICSIMGLLLMGKIIHLLSQLLGRFNSYLWRERRLLIHDVQGLTI